MRSFCVRDTLVRVLFLLVSLWASSSWAHDFWIEPSRFHFSDDDALMLTLREGPNYKGNSVPYIDAWVSRFVSFNGRYENPIDSMIGDDPAARISRSGDQGFAFAYQSVDSYVELPPERFAHYLDEEGLDSVHQQIVARGLAEKPSREYFVRCAKTLVQGEDGTTGKVFAHRFGLPLEITPLADPYALKPGAALELEVLWRGKPVDGVRVSAIPKGRNDQTQYQHTENGRVRFRLDLPGEWLIKAVYMDAIEEANADWRSYWASLTLRY